LAAVVLFLAGSILFFAVGRRADFADQRNRVDALARSSNSTPGTSFAEDLGIPDDIPLNRLRMIATHNSYRKKADRLGLFFIGLAQPGESARLDYAHPPLTRQLDAGVRSFELDLRLRNGEFETAHVPLVDARSTVPSFRLALEEIALWSARNPRHVPLIILLELKSDYSFLDPRLRKIGAADLDKLDALIVSVLGRRLITPDEVRSGAQSLEMAVTRHGWPRLAALRGRILVILHEDETYRRPYIQGRPTLEGRAMFTCAPQGSSDAAIAILNDPIADGSRIQKLVASGYLVRTRADGDGVHNAGLLSAAIASGAQIVSTDFPSAYPASDGYHAAFPNNRMLEIGL
jgi:hypothetical protein